jgi:Zn-dependent protease with chaperone function
MTAARIGLATLTAAWILAAALLWQTDVPGGLEVVPDTKAFAALDLARHERHDALLRWLGLGSLVAQLGALAFLAVRPPPVRGPRLVRAAQYGALAALALLLARLPFGLASLWWQRRYEIVQLGYGQWFLDRIGPLAARAGLLAFAAALCVWLAGRFGRRWWMAAAPVFVLAGAAVTLAHPLLTPRLEPVPRPGVVQEVAELAARQGLERPQVELRRTRGRTRQLNAEALGIGPTTRVILWGTTLELAANVRGVLVAHELAHVSRAHLWKGLAWFVLLLLPGLALLARLVPLQSDRDVPPALLVAFLLLVLATPAVSALSRRYEQEADWVALETTRDPSSAKRLFVVLSERGLRDPSPPRAWTLIFGSHATLAERAGLADTWERWARSAGPRSRAGS